MHAWNATVLTETDFRSSFFFFFAQISLRVICAPLITGEQLGQVIG